MTWVDMSAYEPSEAVSYHHVWVPKNGLTIADWPASGHKTMTEAGWTGWTLEWGFHRMPELHQELSTKLYLCIHLCLNLEWTKICVYLCVTSMIYIYLCVCMYLSTFSFILVSSCVYIHMFIYIHVYPRLFSWSYSNANHIFRSVFMCLLYLCLFEGHIFMHLHVYVYVCTDRSWKLWMYIYIYS